MRQRRYGVLFSAATIWIVSSVPLVWAADSKESVSAASMDEAKNIFANRCATCHGPTGKGDGPVGSALNPKPRDYSDAAWQKGVTDEQIEKIVLEGGPAVGKSPLMPPNPDLGQKPEVVKALRMMVRSFGQK